MKRLTIPAAANHMGCSEYTVRLGIRSGRFPYIKLGGRYLLDQEALDMCLQDEAEANRQKAREEWMDTRAM